MPSSKIREDFLTSRHSKNKRTFVKKEISLKNKLKVIPKVKIAFLQVNIVFWAD